VVVAGRLKSVNPDVLRWARERSGRTLVEVAAEFNRDEAEIEAWESADSEAAPTYGQLETLAYKLYKAPLAVFFFPEPPDEPDAQGQFRLVPGAELDGFEPDTRYAVRLAVAAQESLRELGAGFDTAAILDAVQARRFRSLESLATRVREELGIPLSQQTSWTSLEEAFKEWRAAVEAAGVYVFKRSFKQKKASGFCLYDGRFPVIYINNSSAWARQIFTLFHELAHLLYGVSGVTIDGESYLAELRPEDREVEIACNRFAGVFLVPDADFGARSMGLEGTEEEVDDLARHYCVSREVILRKFHDLGVVSQAAYQARATRYNRDYEEARAQGSSGGNYYSTQASYVSRRYAELVFTRYHEGRATLGEIAGHLGVKAKNIERFEAAVMEAT
jgi:Zn-dependent peptidase ImmA (M78 family)